MTSVACHTSTGRGIVVPALNFALTAEQVHAHADDAIAHADRAVAAVDLATVTV